VCRDTIWELDPILHKTYMEKYMGIDIDETYDEKNGIYSLTSKDMPGLYLAGNDRDLLYSDLNNVIRKLINLDHIEE